MFRNIPRAHNLRCSHRRCFFKKGVLKNFANFTGKHLWWNLFLIKLQAWRSENLSKRDSSTGVFLWKFLRPPILKNICDDWFCSPSFSKIEGLFFSTSLKIWYCILKRSMLFRFLVSSLSKTIYMSKKTSFKTAPLKNLLVRKMP